MRYATGGGLQKYAQPRFRKTAAPRSAGKAWDGGFGAAQRALTAALVAMGHAPVVAQARATAAVSAAMNGGGQPLSPGAPELQQLAAGMHGGGQPLSPVGQLGSTQAALAGHGVPLGAPPAPGSPMGSVFQALVSQLSR